MKNDTINIDEFRGFATRMMSEFSEAIVDKLVTVYPNENLAKMHEYLITDIQNNPTLYFPLTSYEALISTYETRRFNTAIAMLTSSFVNRTKNIYEGVCLVDFNHPEDALRNKWMFHSDVNEEVIHRANAGLLYKISTAINEGKHYLLPDDIDSDDEIEVSNSIDHPVYDDVCKYSLVIDESFLTRATSAELSDSVIKVFSMTDEILADLHEVEYYEKLSEIIEDMTYEMYVNTSDDEDDEEGSQITDYEESDGFFMG